jgi:predicted nuclease of predicted toxin-antitoxin system
VTLLFDAFPTSQHVRDVGLRDATDDEIWAYAKGQGFVIVSKDRDFQERSFVEGAPPKVVWLDVGNAGTDAIANLLVAERERVAQFEMAADSSLLILSLGISAV